MATMASTLRRLAALNLPSEAMSEVLSIIADMQGADEERKAKDRERKRKIHGNSTEIPEENPEKVSPPSLPPFSPPTPPPISPNPSTPSKIFRHRPSAEFEEFWKEYPLRVGRKAAEKAFAKAMQSTDLPTILDGIAKYRIGKPTYADWAHPATWLNAGRWADEHAANTSAPKSAAAQAVPEFKTDAEFDLWWANRQTAGAA